MVISKSYWTHLSHFIVVQLMFPRMNTFSLPALSWRSCCTQPTIHWLSHQRFSSLDLIMGLYLTLLKKLDIFTASFFLLALLWRHQNSSVWPISSLPDWNTNHRDILKLKFIVWYHIYIVIVDTIKREKKKKRYTDSHSLVKLQF